MKSLTTMKRKLTALVCAALLALALPAAAFAANSPSNEGTVTGQNGVTAGVTAELEDGTTLTSNYFKIVPVSEVASNSPVNAVTHGVTPEQLAELGQVAIASFTVDTDYDEATLAAIRNITLTFNVGSQYAGAQATVYIEHNDGAVDTRTATIASNGTLTITIDRFSYFTVVVDGSTIPSDNQGGQGGTTTDTNATSPSTGLGVSTVAAGTAVMAVAAAGVVVALRKKVSE